MLLNLISEIFLEFFVEISYKYFFACSIIGISVNHTLNINFFYIILWVKFFNEGSITISQNTFNATIR